MKTAILITKSDSLFNEHREYVYMDEKFRLFLLCLFIFAVRLNSFLSGQYNFKVVLANGIDFPILNSYFMIVLFIYWIDKCQIAFSS